MGKRIDLREVPVIVRTGYPPPFDIPCAARRRQRLGDAAALSDFGVNLLRLPAGAWSSGGGFVHDDGTPYPCR
jgi:uncharacterized cupin superfamily protein